LARSFGKSKGGFCLALCLLVAACATPLTRKGVDAADAAAVHSDLIRGLLSQGQYYAALAHIDDQARVRGDNDELRALRADTLSALGRRPEAEALYRGLLQGRYAGEGYHGLGLLYARTDPKAAIGSLRAAVKLRPTSAEWRNDLGYALMSAGRLSEALPEVATATELDPAVERYRNNLVILLILMKDESRVARLAQQWRLPQSALGDLRKQAQALQVRQAGIKPGSGGSAKGAAVRGG
jgi:Flp pilus assembly protein TadD